MSFAKILVTIRMDNVLSKFRNIDFMIRNILKLLRIIGVSHMFTNII